MNTINNYYITIGDISNSSVAIANEAGSGINLAAGSVQIPAALIALLNRYDPQRIVAAFDMLLSDTNLLAE